MKSLKNFEVLEPRLDWLTVIGDIPHIHWKNDIATRFYLDYLFIEYLGIPLEKDGDRRVYYSRDLGIEIALSKKRGTGVPYISITFKGHACIYSNETLSKKIRDTIYTIWQKLAIEHIPKVTRLDIAIDILGASVTDVLPNFSNERYEFISSGKIDHMKYFRKPGKPSVQTGLTLNAANYSITCYERIITLKKPKRTENYIAYYKDLYGNHPQVLRIESSIKRSTLTDIFQHNFFLNPEKIDKKTMELKESQMDETNSDTQTNTEDQTELTPLLEKILFLFGIKHRVYDSKKDKYVLNWDRLFYQKVFKGEELKTIKNSLDYDPKKYKFEKSKRGYNLKGSKSRFARALIQQNRDKGLELEYEIMDFKRVIKVERSKLRDAERAYNKLQERYNLTPEEIKKRREALSESIWEREKDAREEETKEGVEGEGENKLV